MAQDLSIQFKRQYKGNLDIDFDVTTAQRNALLTDATRKAGQICYDNEEHKHYKLSADESKWELFGGVPDDEIDIYNDVTYLELRAKITNSELVGGYYYRITDFQTMHIIQESGGHLNVNGVVYAPPSTNYPNSIPVENRPTDNSEGVEPLIILALSPSTISPIVYSEIYPNDILHYDVLDDRCEDNTTPRKGKIVYRKDTKQNLECYYDWRKVKFIRFKLNPQTYDSTVRYAVGAVVVFNNLVYRCIKLTPTTTEPTPATSTKEYWVQIWRIREFFSRYVGMWGGTGNRLGNSIISTDPTLYRYYGTFNCLMNLNGEEVPTDYLTPNRVNNTTIYPWYGALDGAAGSYNNIIFVVPNGQSISGNVFHPNCLYMSFCYNVVSNVIGHDCRHLVGGQQFIENNIGPFFHNNTTILFNANTVASNVRNNTWSGATQRNFFGQYYESNICMGNTSQNTFNGKSNGNIMWGAFENNNIATAFSNNKFYNICRVVTFNQWFNNNTVNNTWGDFVINVSSNGKTYTVAHSALPLNFRSTTGKVFYSSIDDNGVITTDELL